MRWGRSSRRCSESMRRGISSLFCRREADGSGPELGWDRHARSRQGLAAVAVFLLLSALAATTCRPGSAPESRELTPLPLRVSRVPDLGLEPDESIDAFDFVIDDSGSMHFVWSAMRSRPAKAGSSLTEIWYRQGTSDGTHWARPVCLGPGAILGPRIVIAGGKLHVLSGYKLRHWVSADRGATWSELAPVLDASGPKAVALDVCPLEDASLLVAFIGAEATGKDPPADEQGALYITRWREQGASRVHLLSQVANPSQFLPAPKVMCHQGRVHVFAGLNEPVVPKEVANGRSRALPTQRGRLLHVTSADGGLTEGWGPVQELPLPPHREWSVGDLAVLPLQRRVALFFSAYSVYLTMVDTNGVHSPNVRLTPDDEPFVGSYASASVGVAQSGSRVRLVWIDSRYRKSDRTPLMPLGGVPWSDSPEWCNNDVFTVCLPSNLDSVATAHPPKAARVTQPLSQASRVVIRAAGEHFCVAWNGRERVGHGPASAGAPPELFFTFLP